MNLKTLIFPVLIAFAVSALQGPIVIPLLRRMKFGQTEREDGPKSHLKKTGTPTMGGVMILIAVIVTSLFYVKEYPKILPILLVTVGFGLVGFLDDFIKIILHRSEGLTPGQKMLGQFLVTGVFLFYYYRMTGGDMAMRIPFWPGHSLHLGGMAVPVAFLAIIGTVNGANFTDGLDGLASSVTVMLAVFFTVASLLLGAEIHPITCAVAGSLMGFLLFNVFPASVFMGDTGSLALGGFVSAAAYMMDMPIFILIVAMIYWIEILSVMLQVGYFKMTGGKRIFRMAPIHHHFELGGWSETRVVAVFSIVTVLLCLVGLLAL